MDLAQYISNLPTSVAGGGLKSLAHEAPGSKVEFHIPGVSLNSVLEGKVADAVRVDSGLRSWSGEGGTSERENNRNERSFHFSRWEGTYILCQK
jgi:hypothetical protein